MPTTRPCGSITTSKGASPASAARTISAPLRAVSATAPPGAGRVRAAKVGRLIKASGTSWSESPMAVVKTGERPLSRTAVPSRQSVE